MPSNISALEDILGYRFRDPKRLEEALTHPSCSKTHKNAATFNNQRLEFLGDAVLGLAVAKLLFELFPHENEGDLAKRHAALVCGETLTQVARSLGLEQHIRMTESEEATGGRNNASNIEDVCEAVIGALYYDGGLEAAERFIRTHWQALANSVTAPPRDPKTALQEWAQGLGLPLPHYETLSTVGPAHAPIFTIRVSVTNGASAEATGASKRQAEHAAARALLDSLPGQAHG